jgi:TldD protein
MIEPLAELGSVGAELSRRARAAGMMLIWRAQSRIVHHTLVRGGIVESRSVTSSAGHGLQIVTEDGRTTLASRDDLDADGAMSLLERSIEAASFGKALGLTPSRLPSLTPVVDVCHPPLEPFSAIDLTHCGKRLAELEAEIAGRVPGVKLKLHLRAELDSWRIFRCDGTDVTFAMPRCTVGVQATGDEAEQRHGVFASLAWPTPDVLDRDDTASTLLKRAISAARLALTLPDAPNHPAGSFPLVIDYALAKGLAHEAFGHAAEADGFRSSVLAKDGRFRRGEKVGVSHLSIIDEPVENDHAWQPYSSNGVPRTRATIVDHGELRDGLADIWSADAGGVPLNGAARAESFGDAPMARMTNIRIEDDAPLPAPGEFEDYGPEEVRDLLAGAGILDRHPEVVFLSGYSGGQVNPTSGDFVFNCKAIYTLGRQGVSLHKPAIFSGSMFGALGALRETFGPLKLDALGYCGKWGQSVPSSGGSHYFLFLEPDERVRLGGS